MKKSSKFIPKFLKFGEKKNRLSLTLVFSLIVFAVLLAAIGLAAVAVYLLVRFGLMREIEGDLNVAIVIVLMTVVSTLIGAFLAFFISKIPLKPINNLINKMNRLAAGDFHQRLEFSGALSEHPAFKEMSTSFNTLAEQLESTELLRTDFINNFSHEVKTPIVSIAGLARLLQKDNVTEDQRTQYLEAIVEESSRLSYMATNVLNLTKVENQTILTDVTKYNLSEQLRSAFLLLEEKWTGKNIALELDFDEYTVEANEELLKQVWINLIDNAVKFSPEGARVSVSIAEQDDALSVKIGNTGSEISPDKIGRIFNKFYQADESHATEGNGIGLAIVKRITELHGGEVNAFSSGDEVVFEVVLPQRQN